jgi:hypothetical protein
VFWTIGGEKPTRSIATMIVITPAAMSLSIVMLPVPSVIVLATTEDHVGLGPTDARKALVDNRLLTAAI